MRIYSGVDLGSTTTKSVILDDQGEILGRGITNSRSNYDLAASIARSEAMTSARFELLSRELEKTEGKEARSRGVPRLLRELRRRQHLRRLEVLRATCAEECEHPRVAHIQNELRLRVDQILDRMVEGEVRPRSLPMAGQSRASEFFRDRAASEYSRYAETLASAEVGFDSLMSIFDKAILKVESTPIEDSFDELVLASIDEAEWLNADARERYRDAVLRVATTLLADGGVIGTGYGRQRLPFPKERIRSEILCHGLGAHHMFPGTRTVLDIGGQDTKAIQVDGAGIVTSFQMNDRCAAGCGRYLGYIADEMNLGVHELGPLALKSEHSVKISSTCTVFAGAELRDHLSNGHRREDILAGLHRAIILRAMSLLSRSGGIANEFTFTGGVASNPAAVDALRRLVDEHYGERTLNVSPGSIYTGALGAALFCRRLELEQAS